MDADTDDLIRAARRVIEEARADRARLAAELARLRQLRDLTRNAVICSRHMRAAREAAATAPA